MSRDRGIRIPTAWVCAAGLLVPAATLPGCARLTRLPTLASDSGSNGSADSSGDSANSSGESADSSGASADSSDSGESDSSKSESGGGDGGDGAVSATVSLAVVVGIVGLIYLVSLSSAGPRTGTPGLQSAERREALDKARRYLTAHRRQIRADISRGSGAFVDELALAHRLPVALRPRLGAAVQKAQGALDAPLAAGPVDDRSAERFAAALDDAMRADEALRPHVDALGDRLRSATAAR